MSNEVRVTVTGHAGSTPTIRRSERGTEWTTFSVATTRRIRGTDGAYYDGATLWFQVKAWGGAAANIAESVVKGQPLVVAGRLEVDEWMSDSGPRSKLVINADSVGPNLMRGRARFTRVVASRTEPEGAPPGFGGLERGAIPAGQDAVAAGSGPPADLWHVPGAVSAADVVPGAGHDEDRFVDVPPGPDADSGQDVDLTA